MIDWPEKERYTAEDLVEIIRILRRPEGCPWDRAQTHQSIRKNFLEETCEVLEAIDADDPRMLREELGDVLMQVAFHAVLEEEQGRPHVFASAAGQNAGINGWDALKNKEKGRQTLADELDTVPATLPALMRAQKLQKRAGRYGAGPAEQEEALAALDRAGRAWQAAARSDAGEQAKARAAGAMLFAAVDSIRLAGLDAEESLTFASKAFCEALESGRDAHQTEE